MLLLLSLKATFDMLPRTKGLRLFVMVAAENGKYLHATKSISTKKAKKRNVPFHFKFDGMSMGIISIFSVEIYTIRIVGYRGIAAKNDISLNQIWYAPMISSYIV